MNSSQQQVAQNTTTDIVEKNDQGEQTSVYLN